MGNQFSDNQNHHDMHYFILNGKNYKYKLTDANFWDSTKPSRDYISCGLSNLCYKSVFSIKSFSTFS